MRSTGSSEQFVIFVIEKNKISVPEEPVVQLALTRCQFRCTLSWVASLQRMQVVGCAYLQITFDSQVDDRRSHHFAVVVHLPDIAQRGRRESFRWFVSGDNQALFRILAEVPPDRNKVNEHRDEAGQSDDQAYIVRQQPACFPYPAGWLHETLRPADDDC